MTWPLSGSCNPGVGVPSGRAYPAVVSAPLRITPKLITINRENEASKQPPFSLWLWRMRGARYVTEKRYRIAVGKVGHDTPAGMYFISEKERNPPWIPPNSDWVPKELVGVAIPGGDPRNPLRGAWLRLGGSDAIGIHGTANAESIGSRASHGCIRLTEPDVLDLYKRVGLGTPVHII